LAQNVLKLCCIKLAILIKHVADDRTVPLLDCFHRFLNTGGRKNDFLYTEFFCLLKNLL
jgi:hypothetical protein